MLQQADKEHTSHVMKLFLNEDLKKLNKEKSSFDPKMSTSKSFVNKNFDKEVFPRLGTFEKFAFSSVERYDHPFLIPSLKDLKGPKEPSGTMLITDLWTKKIQRDCLNKSKMLNEKNKMEKFLYYKSKKSSKNESITPNQFIKMGGSNTIRESNQSPKILDRKNEIIMKNKLIMMEMRDEHETNIANQKYMGLLNFGNLKKE